MTIFIINCHKDGINLFNPTKKELTKKMVEKLSIGIQKKINMAKELSSGIHKISINEGQILKTNLGKEGTLDSTKKNVKSTRNLGGNFTGNNRNITNFKGDNRNINSNSNIIILTFMVIMKP